MPQYGAQVGALASGVDIGEMVLSGMCAQEGRTCREHDSRRDGEKSLPASIQQMSHFLPPLVFGVAPVRYPGHPNTMQWACLYLAGRVHEGRL